MSTWIIVLLVVFVVLGLLMFLLYRKNKKVQAQMADQKEKMDAVIKGWMAKELERHHHTITNMIEERLNGLSDEELVEFTEEKVADDLQMIRINGSVVGSLAGMALYIVVYLAGQVIHP